tara:strand:+ start:367 stop:543 length:177 start_codon:yes stop_codon:yes gene_type:complete
MAENVIPKTVRYTGVWTSGVVQGVLIAGPPLLLLSASLGLMLLLTRGLLTLDGKGGLD